MPISSDAIYRLTPFRADALALGMLAAVFWRDLEFQAWLFRNKSLLYSVFALLLAGMAVLAIWFQSPDRLLTQTVGYSWIALFYASLLFIVLADTPGPIARVARIGWLRAWGRISYCIYLIHAAMKYLCFHLLVENVSHVTQWRPGSAVALAVVITFTLAKLSWRFFETPLLQKGHQYKY